MGWPQAIESYMNCHARIIHDSDAARRGVHLRHGMTIVLDWMSCAEDLEKMDEEILYIQRACDGDQLRSFLLDHVPPPSVNTSAGRGLQNSLLGFCDSYGSSWLLYLAESWLERELVCIKWQTEDASLHRSSILASWGAAIRAVLPMQSTVIHSIEQERILHKVVELVEGLAAQCVELEDAMISILETAEAIFTSVLKHMQRRETSEKLSAIFNSLKRQCFQPQNPSHAKPETSIEPKNAEEATFGLFTKVPEWESCIIGCLPYNMKT